jgi:hypothetical protein
MLKSVIVELSIEEALIIINLLIKKVKVVRVPSHEH